MKILFAAHQFFPEHYAGTEVLTLGLARELKDRGHDPHVFAAKRSYPVHDIRPGETEDYEHGGIPVRRVGRPREGLSRPYTLDYENPVMAERAREYVREIQPDLVHAMHFQGISASVIEVFKEFDLPVVYTATDFWSVCPVVDLRRHDGVMCRGPELEHCVRCIASRYPGSRTKAVIDRTPNAVLRGAGRLSKTRLAGAFGPLRQVEALKERPDLIREKLYPLDHIIAPTELTRELLVANGVKGESMEVSHYGIDTSGVQGITKNRNLPPPLRVGFIGTLGPHKGCDLLIRAFKQLPQDFDATLTIYGNLQRFKPFVAELRRMAGDDERINFAGTFQPEEIGRVLSEMEVLVVPSRWYENTPLVVYSAFAAGTPVVATDLGGLSEVVRHEENGLRFELENVEDLFRQLRRLYEDPELLAKLRQGIGHVKTVEENVDELEKLYGTLLERKDRAGAG